MSIVVDQFARAIELEGRDEVIAYLTAQRWFGAKGRRVTGVRLVDGALLPDTPHPTVLAIVGVEYAEGASESYLLPLVIRSEPLASAPDRKKRILTIAAQGQNTAAWDVTIDATACLAILNGIRQRHQWQGTAGVFICTHTPAVEALYSLPLRTVRPITAEQSNTSIVYDSQAILKLMRKFDVGLNPDGEVLEFLTTRTDYRHVPSLIGQIRYESQNGTPQEPPSSATVAVLQSFVPNEGDAWTTTVRDLARWLETSGRTQEESVTQAQAQTWTQKFAQDFFFRMQRLGEITAGLHAALASDPSSPAFRPEPITLADIGHWQAGMITELGFIMERLNLMSDDALATLSLTRDSLRKLESNCRQQTEDASLLGSQRVMKIRIHGDYHLGQVLSAPPEFVILDFEGEPARGLEERRAKHCALKDVAGMLRSLNYAKHVASRQSTSYSDGQQALLNAWEEHAAHTFLSGYTSVAKPGEAPFLPTSAESVTRLLSLFQLEKALYELRYELLHRPDWIGIPIQGLQRLLAQ